MPSQPHTLTSRLYATPEVLKNSRPQYKVLHRRSRASNEVYHIMCCCFLRTIIVQYYLRILVHVTLCDHGLLGIDVIIMIITIIGLSSKGQEAKAGSFGMCNGMQIVIIQYSG